MGWFTRDKSLAEIVAPVPGIIEKLKAFALSARTEAADDRSKADDIVKTAATTAKGLTDAAAVLEDEAHSADAVAAALEAVSLDA